MFDRNLLCGRPGRGARLGHLPETLTPQPCSVETRGGFGLLALPERRGDPAPISPSFLTWGPGAALGRENDGRAPSRQEV
jgi:hypothetical protein